MSPSKKKEKNARFQYLQQLLLLRKILILMFQLSEFQRRKVGRNKKKRAKIAYDEGQLSVYYSSIVMSSNENKHEEPLVTTLRYYPKRNKRCYRSA